MKFSVLIPAYNTGKFLEKCLDSILCQNYFDYEIIIVDDGSTDNTGLICDTYAKKYNHIRVIHQSNQKLYIARLSAARIASGDYVLFVDSDDFVKPDYFFVLDDFLKKYPCDMVFFNADIVDMQENKLGTRLFSFSNGEAVSKKNLIRLMIQGDSFNPIWIKCIKRSAYNPSEKYSGLNMAEDVLNTIQVLQNCETIRYCDFSLYNYRMNDASLTHNITVDHLCQSNIAKNELYKCIIKEFGEGSQEDRMYQRSYIKGLIWYCMQVGAYELKEHLDKVLEVKKSNVYITCLHNRELPLFYRFFIVLFEKNLFSLICLVRFLKKR